MPLKLDFLYKHDYKNETIKRYEQRSKKTYVKNKDERK